MGSDPGPLVVWTMLACWLLVMGVWLVGWLYNLVRARKIERRWLSPKVLLGAVLAWGISALIPQRAWNAITIDSGLATDVGLALLVFGTGLAIWGRLALGRMWTGIPSQRAGHELRTRGPFALVRHPIYAGFLAMLAGTALAYGIGSWAGPFVAAAIALAIKIRIEERLLAHAFGADYERYRRRVGLLLPRIPGGTRQAELERRLA